MHRSCDPQRGATAQSGIVLTWRNGQNERWADVIIAGPALTVLPTVTDTDGSCMPLEQFPDEPHFNLREERLNTLTHGLGAVLGVALTVMMINVAAAGGDPWRIVSVTIFGASLITLYGASALYHGSRNPARRVHFKTLDHCAIFLLIAGTYTPFVLVNLRGPVGWTLFAVIWTLAVVGIALKLRFGHRYKILRVAVYLGMGWLIVLAAAELKLKVNAEGLRYIVYGGLTYTVGVVFYLANRLPYNHAIWHLFTLGGSLFHALAVWVAVLPA